ncbi:nicastrin-like, partial [Oncorhynchus keta]|uniref:nicastrin-like n=1 Tax=Oncorhynchus keta TaxID=8018 RepID=UPI00227CD878
IKNASSRVAGVVVVPKTSPPEFSPHTTCPNENTGVYTETYDHNLAHCNTTVWNPRGNDLSYEEFDFPIFSLKEDNETEVIKQCYFDHNRVVNGSGLQYPLCAMQLFSHMHAVTDTATCMRRSSMDFSTSPEPNPPQYYVGVAKSSHQANALTYLVQYLLANLTGTATNLTQSQCKKPDELPNESTYINVVLNLSLYSYLWVQGVVPLNSTQRESFCVRTAVRLVKAVSPAFDLGDYVSKEYSTWTKSQWKFIKARIFLVASRDLEMLTLGVGVAVLFTSLLVTYFVSTKADVLFSSVREPNNAAY